MASLLVETLKSENGIRVVLYTGILERHPEWGWLLNNYQVVGDWHVHSLREIYTGPIGRARELGLYR